MSSAPAPGRAPESGSGPPGQVLDSLGMFAAAAGLAEQVEQAAAGARDVDGLPEHDDIENVVVLGMGGSGFAGDVLTVAAGPLMPVPVVVHKGYGIPNFIDEHTLVFAISFSGDTEEVIEGATAAAGAGGPRGWGSVGGGLAELAARWGVPHVPIAPGIPMPRAGIGALAVTPMVVLDQVGLFPGASSWIDAAVDQLRRRRDTLAGDGGLAADLARRIGRTFPLVYGGGGVGSVAALRWKSSFNENAKVMAHAGSLPEVCHNELCGFGQHGDVTRQLLHLVNLRHEYEHPQIARRFDLMTEILREVVHDVDTVAAEGEGPLAQLLDLVLVGDLVSLHLAAQEGVDPGPIPVLDDLKAALAVD
jgi:glucose/mannose-6-phosphate isomerase